MKPLVLQGFGTSLRVNGRTLEVDWHSEGKKESFRPQQLPPDSILIDLGARDVGLEVRRVLYPLNSALT